VVFGLKRPSMSVFCQAVGHAAIATAIFNNLQWKKALRCSPSAIIAVFHTSSLLFLPKSEIRAGKASRNKFSVFKDFRYYKNIICSF
jgi:hypothetical protein